MESAMLNVPRRLPDSLEILLPRHTSPAASIPSSVSSASVNSVESSDSSCRKRRHDEISSDESPEPPTEPTPDPTPGLLSFGFWASKARSFGSAIPGLPKRQRMINKFVVGLFVSETPQVPGEVVQSVSGDVGGVREGGREGSSRRKLSSCVPLVFVGCGLTFSRPATGCRASTAHRATWPP